MDTQLLLTIMTGIENHTFMILLKAEYLRLHKADIIEATLSIFNLRGDGSKSKVN